VCQFEAVDLETYPPTIDRFGDEDYARIKEIRAWLEQHPQRGALIAYLSDKDPYEALSS
jgi:hypothetical protein